MQQRYIVFIALLLLVSACSTRKKTSSVQAPAKPVVIVTDTIHKSDVPVVKVDTIKVPYVIGLILPLHLEAHFENDTIRDTDQIILSQALPALQFYEGALVAKDSCNQLHVSIQYKIFDCSGDSTETLRILKGNELKKCDAIIAMIGSGFYSVAAKFASTNDIPFILLQNANTQLLENNKHIWLAVPSNSTQIKLMAAYLYKTYPASQFITVYRDVRKENDLGFLFASVIDSMASLPGTCIKVNYSKTTAWTSLQSKFAKQKRNILIIPTSDESYLSSLVTKLEEVKNEYTFMLAGLPTWENFEAIDPGKLQLFDSHFFSSLYVDVDHPRVQNFRKAFIGAYHSDPLNQAFQSYDLINYLVRNHIKFGKNYVDYTGDPNLESLNVGFDFREVCKDCGLENKSLSILKYGDYHLKRVK